MQVSHAAAVESWERLRDADAHLAECYGELLDARVRQRGHEMVQLCAPVFGSHVVGQRLIQLHSSRQHHSDAIEAQLAVTETCKRCWWSATCQTGRPQALS